MCAETHRCYLLKCPLFLLDIQEKFYWLDKMEISSGFLHLLRAYRRTDRAISLGARLTYADTCISEAIWPEFPLKLVQYIEALCVFFGIL